MKTLSFLFTLTILMIGQHAIEQEKTVTVGGAPIYPSKNIIENAVNSKDHTTLVAAVKAAGLVETLSGSGPFTVFAPTDKALDKLPQGTVETLVKPENKATLTGVLTYHVVAGKMGAEDLMKAIKPALARLAGLPLQAAHSLTWFRFGLHFCGLVNI